MNEEEFCDYLIVGGQRHGEVIQWQQVEDELFLSNINHVNREPQGIEPIEERFRVIRYPFQGRTFLLATNVGLDGYDIEDLISNAVIVPLR